VRNARLPIFALLGTIALAIGGLSAVPASASTATTPTPHSPKHKLVHMGTYSPSDYAARAAKLPHGLIIALGRDIHLSGEQFLADGDANAQAQKVIASLKAAGIQVTGSEMSGTRLTVDVASASEVSTVESTGAEASVGTPKSEDFSTRNFQTDDSTDIYGGEGYFFYSKSGQNSGSGSGDLCSIGFNGYSVSTGSPQFVTAGHCQTAMPSANYAFLRVQNNAGVHLSGPLSLGAKLGKRVSGEGKFGSGSDYGIVSSGGTGVVAHNSVATWGGNDGSAPSDDPPLSSTPLSITGEAAATVGAALCKSGSTTGWTCGTVEDVDQSIDVSGHTVNSIIATTCLIPGDSGGGAVIGSYAVGIDSGSDFPQTDGNASNDYGCSNPESDPEAYPDDPGYQSVFFPMVSAAGSHSVQGQQGSHWQLGVTPTTDAPTLSSTLNGATLYGFQKVTGTLSGATSNSTVLLYLDGATIPYAKATASSGSWSISLGKVPIGTHSYVLASGLGWSPGNSVTGSFTIREASRVAGSDHYDTAVLIAQQMFPTGGPIPILYVTGDGYSSSLTVAPIVVKQGGAMLVTKKTSLPSEVASEISALQPVKVVVVGSTSSVSTSVYNKIAALLPGGSTISRLHGSTRYATSLLVAQSVFGTGGTATHIGTLFLAYGGSYGSIQSEVAAAGHEGSPVIEIARTSSGFPNSTLTALEAYTPGLIILSGSTSSISTTIMQRLQSTFGSGAVVRIDGTSTYQTTELIDSRFFSTTSTAYLVSGTSYASAVFAGPLAISAGSPILLAQSSCVKSYDVTALQTWGATSATVVGRTSDLGTNVQKFVVCS
jgi:putative cell wall-binding protein